MFAIPLTFLRANYAIPFVVVLPLCFVTFWVRSQIYELFFSSDEKKVNFGAGITELLSTIIKQRSGNILFDEF